MTHYTTYESPLGTLVIAARDAGISSIRLRTADGRFAPQPGWERDDGALAFARGQLAAYFAGELREFALPLDVRGTPFQLRAWAALRRVPYGRTVGYGELAAAIDAPRASRAVGLAMRANPLTIVLPCHRVIGRDGSPTGYLNGLDTKRRLLAFEADQVRNRTISRHPGSGALPLARALACGA